MTRITMGASMRLPVAALAVVSLSAAPFLVTPAAADDPPAGTVVDVTDFGADGTDDGDDTGAVVEAIEHAKNLDGPTTIFFPEGDYHFYPEDAPERELYPSNTVGTLQEYRMKKLPILIEDMSDVVVDGGGSDFLFHGIQTAFASIRSTNVTFTNFSTDFVGPRVVELTVVETGVADGEAYRIVKPTSSIDYEVEDGRIHWMGERSPVTGEPYWEGYDSLPGRQHYGQLLDTTTGHAQRFNGGTELFAGVSSIEDLDERGIRLSYTSSQEPDDLGFMYQYRDIERDTPGAFIWESENTTLRDLDIHYLQNFGILSQMTDTVTVDGLHFHAAPGQWRSTTNFADLLHFSGVKGTVSITDSYFTNPQDDPINIHGTYLRVVDRPAPDQVTLRYMHDEAAGFQQYFVGDEVEFIDDRTMLPVDLGPVTVTDVEGPSGNTDESLRTTTVTFDRDVPAEITAGSGHVAENITYTPEVHIAGNFFSNAPTRGILVTTRKPVLIEDNHFDQMHMASIFISDDAYQWYESGHVEDVTIRGNTFDRPSTDFPVIFFEPTNREVVPGETVHSNVLIEDNVFNIEGAQVVGGRSVSDLTFRDNIVQRYHSDVRVELSVPTTELAPGDVAPSTVRADGTTYTRPLFALSGSQDVTLAGNRYDNGLNLRFNTSQMDPGEVDVTQDAVVVDADNQRAELREIGYVSTNPEVATVDDDGRVVAHRAGETDIIAFAASDVGAHESEPVTISVTGEPVSDAPDSVRITTPLEDALSPGDTRELDAVTVPPSDGQIIWSVRDVVGADVATVDGDGALTAHSPGVAEVVAATAGGAHASALVAVHDSQASVLDGRWDVQLPDPEARHELTPDGSLLMTPAGSGSMWQADSADHSAGNITVGSDLSLDVGEAVTVQMAGTTASGWEEAGIALFAGRDDYLTVQRKHNNLPATLNVVTESAQQADESRNVPSPGEDPVWLRITRTGADTYQGAYSVDGQTFTDLGAPVVNSTIDDARVAFVVATKTSSSINNPFIFSDLVVGGEAIPFGRENLGPVASDVAVVQDGATLRATWDFTDGDDDGEAGSIVRWTADGAPVGQGPSLAVSAALVGSQVVATVVPADDAGGFGAPASSAAVTVSAPEGSQTDAGLVGVDVRNGVAADVDGAVHTSRSASEALLRPRLSGPGAQAEVAVDGVALDARDDGFVDVPLAGERTDVVVEVTSADGSVTQEYPVTVVRHADNRAGLAAVDAEGVWTDFTPGEHFYLEILDEDVNQVCLALELESDAAQARVEVNGREVDGARGAYGHAVVPGLNTVDVWVAAQDATTSAHYRLSAISPGPAEPLTPDDVVCGDEEPTEEPTTEEPTTEEPTTEPTEEPTTEEPTTPGTAPTTTPGPDPTTPPGTDPTAGPGSSSDPGVGGIGGLPSTGVSLGAAAAVVLALLTAGTVLISRRRQMG